jgi:hypothetical protein
MKFENKMAIEIKKKIYFEDYTKNMLNLISNHVIFLFKR